LTRWICFVDDEPPLFEVDIGPAEPKGFTFAQPKGKAYEEERHQPVAAHLRADRLDLLHSEGVLVAPADLRSIGERHDVSRDHALALGFAHGRSEHGADRAHAAWGVAFTNELVERRFDLCRCEPGDRDMPQEPLDVPRLLGVGRERARPHPTRNVIADPPVQELPDPLPVT
jgi:hypothetical protein